MSVRTTLITTFGIAVVAFASPATFAREDRAPRGADRPADVRQVRGADDAAKAPLVTTNADRHGGRTTPDDHRNDRGDGGNRGGKDDGPGHR